MTEQDLIDLKLKIDELKTFSQTSGLDLSDEIAKLEERFSSISQSLHIHLSPWQKVQIARHQDRPTTLDYISELFDDFFELHGDRFFGDDAAIVGGIASFDGLPVTVIGHQKGKDTKDNIRRNFGMPNPEGYRKALRLMEQANKFNRPIICFINTAGAYPGVSSEERGQSEAIARNLREMSGFTVPILCIVIGEGGSGGALALSVGNRILMLEHAFYSVISPEGAATILWKDASKAQQAAEAMKITAQDLLKLGVADEVIPEPPGGAQKDIKAQSEYIRTSIRHHLHMLLGFSGDQLVEDRFQKFMKIGSFEDVLAINDCEKDTTE